MSDSLLAAAERRWQAIAEAHPDLAPAVDLQRRLVTLVMDTWAAVRQAGLFGLPLSLAALAAKLSRGVPILRGEALAWPPGLFGIRVLRFCDYLAEGGAGGAATRIRDVLAEGRLDTDSLLAASLGRNQRGLRQAAWHLGVSPDLLWLIGELAVGPVAYELQRRAFEEVGRTETRALLGLWDRGYCPACGSWPALAEVCLGERRLRCSFCGAAWQTATPRCIYCAEAGEPFGTLTPDLERSGRRLELCRSCASYLKSIDVPEPVPYPLTTIDDLETMDLDTAAIRDGYRRPPLPDLGPTEGPPGAPTGA